MTTPRRARNTNKIGTRADAVLTLDPASVSNSGLCLRTLKGEILTPVLKQPRVPVWYKSDWVWNSVMHDELGYELGKLVPRGGRVVFAATGTAFNGVAMDLGRAIGCIEGLLHDLNVFPDSRVVKIADNAWRAAIFPSAERAWIKTLPSPKRRQAWKDLAIAHVRNKYRLDDIDDNSAEATLLNDYIILHRSDLYAGTEGTP